MQAEILCRPLPIPTLDEFILVHELLQPALRGHRAFMSVLIQLQLTLGPHALGNLVDLGKVAFTPDTPEVQAFAQYMLESHRKPTICCVPSFSRQYFEQSLLSQELLTRPTSCWFWQDLRDRCYRNLAVKVATLYTRTLTWMIVLCKVVSANTSNSDYLLAAESEDLPISLWQGNWNTLLFCSLYRAFWQILLRHIPWGRGGRGLHAKLSFKILGACGLQIWSNYQWKW